MDRRQFLSTTSATALAVAAGCLSSAAPTDGGASSTDADGTSADSPADSPTTTTTTTTASQDTFISDWDTTTVPGRAPAYRLSDWHTIEAEQDVYTVLASAAVAEGDDAALADPRLDLVTREGPEWTIAQGAVPSEPAAAQNSIEATRSLFASLEGREVALRTSLSTHSGADVDLTWTLVIQGGSLR